MNAIFVSTYFSDRGVAVELIRRLREVGVAVEHSPLNPSEGSDDRWRDWYARGLPTTLSRVQGFVAVIDEAWESSCWMAEESRLAAQTLPLSLRWYWNPSLVEIGATGMQPLLTNALPGDLAQAVPCLLGRKA